MARPPLAFEPRPDAEVSQPKTTRTRDESAVVRKRTELRRQVGIARLMQQGLTRFEAEEQWQFRIGRRV